MKFKINIDYNIDKSHTVRNGTRKAILNHERRIRGYMTNKSIDPKLSKYNEYHTLFSYKNAIAKTLEPYIKHHNNLKSVKTNPKRKIKSVKQLLEQRGKRIPYKYIVLKMGSGKTQKELIKLFKSKDYKYADYAKAVNESFLNYAKYDNSNHNHIKFDHEDVNLDETRRHGAPHSHLGALGIATTKSGKTSLSFDRATKQQYGGNTNIAAWHIMQQQEAHNFLNIATPIFQKYLGNDFNFELARNPSADNGLTHDAYIKVQEANDRLRASNQQIKKVASSTLKQSEKSTARAKSLKLENQRLRQNQEIIRYNWFQKYSQLNEKYSVLKNKVQSGISSNNHQLDWLKKPKTSLKSSIINSMKNYAKSYASEYVTKYAKNLRQKASTNKSSGRSTKRTNINQKHHSNSDNDFAKMLGYKSPKQMQNKIKSAAGVNVDNNKKTAVKKKKIPNPNNLSFSSRSQKPLKQNPSDDPDFN